MPVRLIAHPFRLGNDGRVQTHEQNSDAYLAERIAFVLGCHPGERPLVPAFGVNDPAYNDLTLPAIQNQMTIYGIPVNITGVSRTDLSDSTASYKITFERIEEQDS